MTTAHLFAGIGGFALASDWMGWHTAFNCEVDEKLRNFLKSKWPDAHSYGDINHADFTIFRNKIDVLTGGPPCQPVSLAGNQLGEDDHRFLWNQTFRALREIQPPWAVFENVPGLLTMQRGMVLERICTAMENEGYEVQTLDIPAQAKGADHRRDRLWIIAHASGKRRAQFNPTAITKRQKKRHVRHNTVRSFKYGNASRDTVVSRILRAANGLSEGLAPWHRNAAIKAAGNAIQPQIAHAIYQAIQAAEMTHNDQ